MMGDVPMGISFEDEGPKLSIQDLLEVDRRIGSPIPASFREFLLHHNGGKPQPDGFWIYERDRQSRVDWSKVTRFAHVGGGGHHDLVRFVPLMRDLLLPTLFPCGDDLAGNAICISTGAEDGGTVYYWNHEFEGGMEPSLEAVFFLAPSFAAFLNSLMWDVGDSE